MPATAEIRCARKIIKSQTENNAVMLSVSVPCVWRPGWPGGDDGIHPEYDVSAPKAARDIWHSLACVGGKTTATFISVVTWANISSRNRQRMKRFMSQSSCISVWTFLSKFRLMSHCLCLVLDKTFETTSVNISVGLKPKLLPKCLRAANNRASRNMSKLKFEQ